MERKEIKLISRSPENTFKIGSLLATVLKAGDVIALYADLGGGKTVFTQGICKGLGVNDYVTSPTFTLIQEYQGDKPVAHFDFYRLEKLDEIEALGLDTYFDSESVSIIEWADRAQTLLPGYRIDVSLNRIQINGSHNPELREIILSIPDQRLIPELSEWLS